MADLYLSVLLVFVYLQATAICLLVVLSVAHVLLLRGNIPISNE